jgi:hypothetical protein
MLSGKRFRLKEETIAIKTIGGKRVAIQVPAGSVVTVKSGPRPDDTRMVDVYWDGGTVVMFADDIQKRGEQVAEAESRRMGRFCSFASLMLPMKPREPLDFCSYGLKMLEDFTLLRRLSIPTLN